MAKVTVNVTTYHVGVTITDSDACITTDRLADLCTRAAITAHGLEQAAVSIEQATGGESQ